MEESRKKLYDKLSTSYSLGTFDEFNEKMNNEESRRKVYDKASEKFNLGSYEDYSAKIGGSPQDTTSAYKAVVNSGAAEEKETNTTFGEGFKQEARNLGAGLRALGGEALNLFTGSSLDDRAALGLLNEAEQAGMPINDYLKQRNMNMLRSLGQTPSEEGGEFSQMEADLAKQDAVILEAYQKALEKAGGNANQARKILEEEANTPTRGDIMIDKAADTLSEAKENKGWAWLGGLAPQMVGNASAIALAYLSKGRSARVSSALMGTSKALGLGSMATMTGSTAGMSMVEARQNGASDFEVWATGLADAAIEWLTEKIPFDRYTKKIYKGAKGKMTKGAAEALSSDAGKVELEKLLNEANKKLGGKLFSGKNALEYIKSVGIEAGSEALAEGLQTITPMIYQNPEEYPTLAEIWGNSIEGMKGGLVMGAFLGGASNATSHALNKERRKNQGYVDVAMVQFGKNSDPEVVEVLSVSDDTNLATVLRDGEQVNIDKNAIQSGYSYRFSYADFENARLTQKEDEAIDTESVTEGQAKAAGDRVAIAATELEKTLEGLSDQDKQLIYESAEKDAEVSNLSEEAKPAYEAYKEALQREKEVKATLAVQQEKAKDAIRTKLEAKFEGPFYQQKTDADGNTLTIVETGMLQDGRQVYVISEVNEAGEALGIAEDGQKMIVKNDMLKDGTQIRTMVEFLDERYAEQRAAAEQERMASETQRRNGEVASEIKFGSRVNLGTREEERWGTINSNPNADGAMVLTDDGEAVQLSMNDLANMLNKGAILTDTERTNAESAEILGAEAALKQEKAQNVQQASDAVDEAVVAEETMKESEPLPLKQDGSVDQTTLWNQNPERWAEWNDEQRQDGGVNSLGYINSAISREQAKVNKLTKAYEAEADFDVRAGIEQEINTANERLARLISLQQKYAPLMQAENQQAENASEQPAEAVESTTEEAPIENTDPVRQTLTDLYNDPELSESEIEDYINANVEKAQSELDKHIKKAPKMGTDMAKYKEERAKHQEKTAELEKQRDYWKEVQSYVEIPAASEMDMEPQNALEFTANELTRKDGVKLLRDSFVHHTGYGSEAGNFLAILRSKKNGGLTLEAAGERLMEMDRENNTGFFDQNDPNAGLNAILDVIGGARTSGDISGYIRANREQMAREEVAAARNAMLEELKPAEVATGLKEDLPEDIFPDQFISSLDEDMPNFRDASEGTTDNIGADDSVKVRKRIDRWAKRLGIKVNVIEDASQIKNAKAAEAIANGKKIPGWYEPETGEVCIYIPYAENVTEVDKTVIHEVVSHKGLRGLLGKSAYDALCDSVWKAISKNPATANAFIKYPGVLSKERLAEYDANPEAFVPTVNEARKAADEFIAHRSESLKANKSVWRKMIDDVKRIIHKLTGNYTLGESIDELLERSLERYETIAKMDLEGVIKEGQSYQGIIDAATGAKIDPNTNVQAEGNVAFRAADSTLVGMHNISEDKLRKAIKQGGLANPSTAVVNIAEYSLEGYGDISLIMPSSLVDPETGDNIGTYTGDAWTPTYPTISRQIDDEGWKIVKDRIRAAVGENNDLYHDIVNGVDNYLSDDRNSRLEFVFLKEKGIEPKIELKGADGFVGMRNLEAILGVEGLRDGMESYEKYKAASPMAKRSFNTWQRVGGDKKAHKVLKDELRQIPEFAKLMGLGEDLSFAQFDSFTYSIFRKEYDAGNVDTTDTLGSASRYVDANDLRSEFEAWLESLMQEAGAKEVFFAGWTRDGDRIYKDNTLKNVSRHMRMQGRENAYNDHGLSATKSALLQRLTSLAEIRKNRARLQDEASYNKAYDELKERLYSVISQLADMEKISDNPFMNIDYAESRLQDAITKRNPIAYLNSEYGYSIDPKGEYAAELKSFIKDVQKMPAKYFETKFERPVYLNEFAAAVMPTSTSGDVKQAIAEAGLPIFEYDSTVEGARREATLKATEEDGVRFRIIGEEGAANLDAAEEATIRLDNLDIARQMEAAGKDAKTIRLATGWERGADKLWRYEVADEYNLTNLEKRLQEELGNGSSKTWGIVYPSDLGQLLKEYPEFNVDITVWVGEEFDNTGEYSPATEGDGNTYGKPATIEVRAKTISDIAPLLAHEIQHAVQEIEGFAEGGNPRGLIDKLSTELDKRVASIKELQEAGKDEEAEELRQISKGLAEAVVNHDNDPYGNYKKLAGEVEARNAAKRFGVTMQERRETLLSETEDVAREDQIVLMEGLGVNEMGSKETLRMADIYAQAASVIQTENQQKVIAVFGGQKDHEEIKITSKDGNDRSIVIFQGGVGAGAKHSILNHYGTTRGVIDVGDILMLPDVFAKGDRTQKGDYVKYVLKIGKKKLTAYMQIKGSMEYLNDYYSSWKIKNKSQLSVPYIDAEEAENTLSALRTENKDFSDDKGSNISEENNTLFRASNENQAIFVSNAAKAVEAIKQEKATPEQWLKMLEKAGGLKAGEDKWIGLSDWLKASDKKTITKQEVLDFIEENMIIIEEQHYSNQLAYENNSRLMDEKYPGWQDAFSFEWDDYRDAPNADILDEEEAATLYNKYNEDKVEVDEDGEIVDDTDRNKVILWGEDIAKILFGLDGNAVRPIHDTREVYTTKGLINRHEIALTVPTIESWGKSDMIHFGDAGDGRAVAWIRFGETYTEDTNSDVNEYLKVKYSKEDFEAGNFTEEDWNKLRDARKQGKKILVIDEIQSKRHQEGREKGYRKDSNSPAGREIKRYFLSARDAYNAYQDQMTEKYGNDFENASSEEDFRDLLTTEEFTNLLNLRNEWEIAGQAYGPYKGGIPDAPFDKNWHELAMKRMLRYAAENGYDIIAWTKGDQQAERYNIGSYVSSIEMQEEYDGNRDFAFYMGDSDEALTVTVDENGTVVSAEDHLSQAEGRPLADLVGKEMAVKMMQMEEYDVLEDTDLKVGNEGMKGFYDKMLPAFMNKYGKKWGVKVEDIELPKLEGGLTMHSIPVTEEMKASVMEGQVMFRMRGENESAFDFVQSVCDEIKFAYPNSATIYVEKLAPYVAKKYGYTLEQILKTSAFYREKGDFIVIFAHESINDSDRVKKSFYHESIHREIRRNYPYAKRVGEYLWQHADEDKHLTDIKNHVIANYKEPNWHEEMLCYALSAYMIANEVEAMKEALPSDLKNDVTLILYNIGYGRERKRGKITWKHSGQKGAGGSASEGGAGLVTDNGQRNSGLSRRGVVTWGKPTKEGDNSEVRFRTTEITPEVRDEMAVIAATALVNGNYMKAPNGKDSNLTAEQWAMVRTKGFKSWFGDWENDPENASKVVDENGEPMVVYHGTAGVINEFEDQQRSPGFWFVDREDVANGYAESASVEFGEEKNVISVFLNIRNPRVEDAHGEYPAEFALQSYVENDNGVYKVFDTYEEAEAYRKENVPDGWVGASEVGDQHDLVERAKELGHDGVIMKNMHDQAAYAETRVKGTQTNYVVFDPAQIKSATDNTGEYSDKNGDIRYRINSDSEAGIESLVERTFRTSGAFSFSGKEKIESRDDVAFIFKQLEDSAIENSFLVFVKDGIPTIIHVGMGDIASTMIDNSVVLPAYKDFGADKIYMVHNHPSGSLYASKADLESLFTITKQIPDVPVEGIIINTVSGEYASFNLTDSTQSLIPDDEGKVPVKVLSFDKNVFAPDYKSKINERKIKDSSDVASFLSAHRLGEGSKVGALLLNRQNMIYGNLVTNDNEVSVENADTLASQIAEAANRTGSSAVILFGDFDYSDRALRSLSKGIKNASGNTISLLDVVRLEGNHTLSLADDTLPSRSTLSDGIRFRVNENPTEAQKEAGNYKMGHLNLDGYRITIENPKGSVRRGIDSKGNAWENTLNNDYGYIRGTEGVDGDHIDIYLSDNPSEGNVFVVDQVNPQTREFDEHKVMYGFNSAEEAREAYLANFSEGWNGLGTITEVSKDEFKKWIQSSHRKTKPFSEYKSVNAISMQSEGMSEEVMTGTPTEEVVAEGLILSLQDFTRLAGNIYEGLPSEYRTIVGNAFVNGADLQQEIFRIPSRLVEKQNFSDEEIELVKMIADKVQTAVLSTGIELSRPLTTNEALWMLDRSINPPTDVLGHARAAVVADNLGFSPAMIEQVENDESDIRFREVSDHAAESVADVYNQSASYYKNRLYEVFVDQYDSVDGLIKAIEEATGKPAKSFEDVRYALNQLPAKSGAKAIEMARKYIVPMWDAVKDLVCKYNLTEDKIARYTRLKHGLERNEEFPRRDAREYYQNAYNKKVAAIEADDSLEDFEKRSQIAKAKKDLDFHFESIDRGSDAKFQEFREKDYSGIMAAYEGTYDNLADAEQAAKEEVESFEAGKEAEIAELWKRINALNKATLKVQYESGQMSKALYERLKEQFKYYVPLRGFMKDTAEDVFDYYSHELSGFEGTTIRAEGRTTEAESPFGHMAAMMSSAIVAGEKNAAKLPLYYFALNRKDQDLLMIQDVWYVKRADSDEWQLSLPPVKATGESIADYGQRVSAWEESMKALMAEGKAKKGKQNLSLEDVVHIEDKSEKEHYIRVMVNGQEKWMIVNGNPRAAQAINGLLNIESDPYFSKFLGKVMRELAQMSTSYNPEFWMTNLERDFMTTFATVTLSEDKEYRQAFMKNYRKAWDVVKLLPKLKDGTLGDAGIEGILKEAVEAGLQTGFSHIKANEIWDKEMEQHFKDIDAGKSKKAVKAALGKLQNVSESMELVSRFAVYMTSREMGRSIEESVANGKEVTANFNRKGSGRAITFEEAKKLTTADGKTFREKYGETRGALAEAVVVAVSRIAQYGRKHILFFNASIQGIDKWMRLAKKKKGNAGKLAAYFGGQLALGFIISLLYGLDDDDEYQENISDYDRRNNLMIGGNGHYIKVALPHDVRAFYGMGDILYNYLSGNYKHHTFKESFATLSKQMLSISPVNVNEGWQGLIPDWMSPVIEAGTPFGFMGLEGTNKNFAGMPIRKETPWLTEDELKQTPKYTLAGDYTWGWLVDVSEALNRISGGNYKEKGLINIDPARIQHYIEGWTGGIGKTTGNFATFIGQLFGEDEWKAANTPFLNKVFTITDERSQNKLSNSQFYAYRNAAETSATNARAFEKDRESDLLREEKASKEYKIYQIYNSRYKKAEEEYTKQLKVARNEKEEKRIKELRDANRKRFLNELSNKGLLINL